MPWLSCFGCIAVVLVPLPGSVTPSAGAGPAGGPSATVDLVDFDVAEDGALSSPGFETEKPA